MTIEVVAPGHLCYEFRLQARGSILYLVGSQRAASRDLLAIGCAIFEFEKLLKLGPQHRLDIAVESVWSDQSKKKAIETCLERLLSYVLLSDTQVRLVRGQTFINQVGPSEKFVQSDAVCLFSGGVDSLSGLLSQIPHSRSMSSVFCSHLYQSRVVSLVRGFRDTVLTKHNIQHFEIPVPPLDTTGYAQTRGFLYVLSAASVAAAVSSAKVVVSECGPTMYQPRFSPADQVTMTTHPFVIERAGEIMEYLVNGIEIALPFEDSTKAELMALCPNPNLIPISHSCISQRLELHDGTCYGCVIRRLASIATSTPDTKYARDPLTDENVSSGNLLSVLDFCSDMLIERNQLSDYHTGLIDQYDKWDLFERFAMDNCAALYQLQRHTPLSPPVARIYNRIRKHFGGTRPFKARLLQLQSPKKK